MTATRVGDKSRSSDSADSVGRTGKKDAPRETLDPPALCHIPDPESVLQLCMCLTRGTQHITPGLVSGQHKKRPASGTGPGTHTTL